VDLKVVDQDSECASGYSPIIGKWNGYYPIVYGDKSYNYTDSVASEYYLKQVSQNDRNIADRPLNFTTFMGKKICVKRDSALDFYSILES